MQISEELLLRAAQPLIELAIAEDVGPGDATSEAILPADQVLCGRIIAKAAGVIAGLPVAQAVFKRVDPTIEFVAYVTDGQEVVAGELIAEATGAARALLSAERIALNFLQRMSGIATLTRQFVAAVACTSAVILDTRKTVPGHRVLDKYAVRMGGGLNHRMSLYDMMLIKDNHVDAAGGVLPAIERARTAYPALPIEVEVRTLDELRQALSVQPPPERIMLDNMDVEQMCQAVRIAAGRVPLEASGGVTLERATEVAATGVDCISVGALTHSPAALDISMELGVMGVRSATPDRGRRVAELKSRLGERLVMLAHHYQRDEVVALADFVGDSLELARRAAQTNAQFIVFCGVHFMAETAAVLARPGQLVLIPDASAGCYLADTATLEAVRSAWERLADAFSNAEMEVTPITYVNSTAALKAFCGYHGGLVCTSSNAEQVMQAALERRGRILFFPDQHLGRNTARRMGMAPYEMLLWDSRRPPDVEVIRRARVILWPGACNVHQRFRPEHVHAVRQLYPDARVLVHPECREAVVQLADDAGSTGHIIRQVSSGRPGTHWAIGTETRLVRRLQRQHPEQTIRSLADVPPFCRTMGQITLDNLALLLEGLVTNGPANPVIVDQEQARWARLALERMLAL